MTISQLKKDLKSYSTRVRAKANAWYFKTGKGQYGEGDKFLGVTVPNTRKVARKYHNIKLREVDELLKSKIHEERLCAVFILVGLYKVASQIEKKSIFDFYLSHTKYINNWDLVDSSASYIVGDYLSTRDRQILLELAKSSHLWEKRIAIVATLYFIVINGEYTWTFRITKILMKDKHDLINKACGWMLREVGKRASEKKLCEFLDTYATTMPRTMLRYAIERLPENKRKYYLHSK